MRLARRKRQICLVGLTLACLPLPAHARRPRHSPPADSPAVILHSQAPYRAVRIPFKLVDGLIYVHVSFNGKHMECLVDTGTNDIVIPEDAGVYGATTGKIFTVHQLEGADTEAHQIVLPCLKIGAYELRQALALVTPSSSPQNNVLSAGIPALGDDAFCHTVLTIDYTQRELILRQPQYDFIRNGNAREGDMMNFDHSRVDGADYPCVTGTVRGKRSLLLLDTGYSGDTIGVTPQFSAGAISEYGVKPMGLGWAWTSAPRLYVPGVTCTLLVNDRARKFPLIVQSPAVVFPNLESHDGIGANLGTAILDHFRVTVDYPRRRILLEPNPAPVQANVVSEGQAAKFTGRSLSAIIFGALLLVVVPTAFWVVEIGDAARRRFPDASTQALWLLLMLLTFVPGALVYHFVGKKQGARPGGTEK